MKRLQTFLTALTLLASVSGAHAQEASEDEKIIKLYCNKDGKFEVENGKTVFKCAEGTKRLYYESLTQMLQMDPKTATPEAAFATEKWREYILQKTMEQLKSEDPTCVLKDQKGPEFDCKNTKEASDTYAKTKNYAEAAVRTIFKDYGNLYDEKVTLAEYVNKKNAPTAGESTSQVNRTYTPALADFKSFDTYFPLPALKSFGFYSLSKIVLPSPKLTLKPVTATNLLGMRKEAHSPLGAGNYRPPIHVLAPDQSTSHANETKVVVAPTVELTPEPSPKPAPAKEPEVKVNTEPADCKSELEKAVSELLADDQKNIIGLQYELTVLKMASLAAGNNVKTLEALIKKQSQTIAALDNGVLDKMNAVYKTHGLPEDAKKVAEHLKQKAANANYYAKDKRFFNEDSSAFVLAYQQLNKASNLKDSDVSVLWFMDKVSGKARSVGGQYSSLHNRTNLSTRIAQYTGAIDPKKALSKEQIDEMVKSQRAKIDDELKTFMADFKSKNAACYASLFSDANEDCHMELVDSTISGLLAVSSKIASTDLISLDSQLKGGLDGKRFSLGQYVATAPSPRTPAAAATTEKPETDNKDLIPVVITAPPAAKGEDDGGDALVEGPDEEASE